MKTNLIILASLATLTATTSGASIAMNFAENASNQVFAGGSAIGPTLIDSANWNSSINADTGTLATGEIGSLTTLRDDSGNSTTATLTWASNNAYFNGDGTATDEAKLAVGYLDDSTGASFTLSNIPYAQYDVYVLFTSDSNGDYQHGPLTIGGTGYLGGGNFNAHGRVTDGTGWVLADGSAFGNYAFAPGLTSSSLTVSSVRDGAARGPITGFVIQAVPEPSSAMLIGLAGLGFVLRRRK